MKRLLAVSWLLAVGCAGATRAVAPDDARGYRPVALRDIAALGLKDQNIEIEASVLSVGRGPAEGLVAVHLTGAVLPAASAAGDFSSAIAALPEEVAAMSDARAVTLTIPTSRYAEVRDLKPFTRVRARGYLSNAPGFGFAIDCESDRYLWIDRLEALP